MVKLLSKQETTALKSVERKKEIDEGTKLAKKIDNLRELSAKEQAGLTKFRDENLKKIHEEIDGEVEKRDRIRLENKELEIKNAKARIPLDKEWTRVKDKEIELSKWEEQIIRKAVSVSIREDSLVKRESKLKLDEERSQEKMSRADDYLIRAKEIELEAEKRLIYAQSIEDRAINESNELQAKLNVREAEIAGKEVDLNNREKHIANLDEANRIERIKNEDMRRTLEIELKRLKK